MSNRIVWDTPLETRIVWGFIYTERGYFMYQHTSPVRKGNPQYLQYTFRKRSDGTPIDLTDYATVKLSSKPSTIADEMLADAAFDADKTTGVVFIEGHLFTADGPTSIQFIAYKASGEPLYGDLAMVTVAKNNIDLGQDEVPTL